MDFCVRGNRNRPQSDLKAWPRLSGALSPRLLFGFYGHNGGGGRRRRCVITIKTKGVPIIAEWIMWSAGLTIN